MWIYQKQLQHPVKIERPNPRLAGVIITALGGPDGETGAAMRYLNQRYTMPDGRVIATLTDVGSEELGHLGQYECCTNSLLAFVTSSHRVHRKVTLFPYHGKITL